MWFETSAKRRKFSIFLEINTFLELGDSKEVCLCVIISMKKSKALISIS